MAGTISDGRRFWQTQGEHEARPIEVVGVAQDAKYRSIGEAPRACLYVPFAQQPQSRVELFVKHAAGPSMATDLRVAIRSVEPGLAVVAIQTLDEAALALLSAGIKRSVNCAPFEEARIRPGGPAATRDAGPVSLEGTPG